MNGRKQTQMGRGGQPQRLLPCEINRVVLNFLFECPRFERLPCVCCVFPREVVTPWGTSERNQTKYGKEGVDKEPNQRPSGRGHQRMMVGALPDELMTCGTPKFQVTPVFCYKCKSHTFPSCVSTADSLCIPRAMLS